MEKPMNTLPTRTLSSLIASGVIACILLLGGCATAQPPSPQLTATLATANETVKQAREAGAQEYAPLELQTAEQKLEAAKMAIARKDNERAGWLANEAMVDAKLAEVKARSVKTQAAAQELQDGIEALRQEIARKKNG